METLHEDETLNTDVDPRKAVEVTEDIADLELTLGNSGSPDDEWDLTRPSSPPSYDSADLHLRRSRPTSSNIDDKGRKIKQRISLERLSSLKLKRNGSELGSRVSIDPEASSAASSPAHSLTRTSGIFRRLRGGNSNHEQFEGPSLPAESSEKQPKNRAKYHTAPVRTRPIEVKRGKALTEKKKVKYPSLTKGVKKRLGVRRAAEPIDAPPPVYFKVLLDDQPITSPSPFPNMLYIILEYLYTKQAYLEEGIFRVGGSVATIQRLSRECDKVGTELLGNNILANHNNPHDIASLLKLWLKELPEPLIPTTQFQAVVDVNKTDDLDLRLSQWAVQMTLMPGVNRACLKHILSFARLVIHHRETNMMKLTNVANVLAPTIMRTKDDKDFLTNFGIAGGCVVFMLEHFVEIFGVYEPLDFMVEHLERSASVLSMDLTLPA